MGGFLIDNHATSPILTAVLNLKTMLQHSELLSKKWSFYRARISVILETQSSQIIQLLSHK